MRTTVLQWESLCTYLATLKAHAGSAGLGSRVLDHPGDCEKTEQQDKGKSASECRLNVVSSSGLKEADRLAGANLTPLLVACNSCVLQGDMITWSPVFSLMCRIPRHGI